MAYKKETLKKKALEAVEENGLYFLSQVISYLPCSERTFYYHELHILQELKDALEHNRIQAKKQMQKKWLDSDNPTLQLALYRLLSNDYEHMKLNQQHIDHTTGGEKIQVTRKIVNGKND